MINSHQLHTSRDTVLGRLFAAKSIRKAPPGHDPPSFLVPSWVHMVCRTNATATFTPASSSCHPTIHYLIQEEDCSLCFMRRCRRIQSSLSLSGTTPRWSIHLHHRHVRRGPVELPLDAGSYSSTLISTSLATTVRGHVDRFDINHRSRGSRTIAVPNMADKSNARSEEQHHSTTDAPKLVNRLNESRSPYVRRPVVDKRSKSILSILII
jgi:hypothetical protein